MSAAAPSAAPGVVLVATKLHVPEVRPGLVSREQLLARLDAGADRKLTLVCAPAGWGKTFLLSQWHAAEAEERPFAWVSLDPGDDDPARFWSYVIGALRSVEPDVGGAALTMLPNVGPGLVEAVLPNLLNELAGLPRPLVLVLDDYHLLHDELIHASVAFLLRHLPRTVHLAIASRADPPLPLARLRAAGELVEIRATQLRFSDDEADALLNGVLALELDASDVELLQERTEGWPAGLQLAALSLRDRADRHAFVDAFAGDDRQIGEYLHEVLEGQDRELRDFLLRTSILDRLCAPLCDAVVGDDDASELLADAYRSNLFLVALDARGHWYRYHHLFRDLLRQELARSEPELTAELHRRAFVWHHENGHLDDAIGHATTAGAIGEASELIARHWLEVWQTSPGTVARWLDALPPGAVAADAHLCLVRAWAALFLGQLDAVEQWVGTAEQCEHPGPLLDGMETFEASTAILRSGLAYIMGDLQRAGDMARRAPVLTESDVSPARSLATMLAGIAGYFAGDLANATEALERIRRFRSVAWPQTLVSTFGVLADARADLGESEAAQQLVTEADQVIDSFGLGESPTAAMPQIARGKLLELRGELAAADAAFARAAELAGRASWRLDHAYALILRGALKRRRKDYDAARSLIREARRGLASCPDPAGMLTGLLARTERALQLGPAASGTRASSPAPELSEREFAVLRLLATDLSQREIGSELYVSLNTVKSHTRSVFRKLGVTSRAEAVARARDLALL